LESVCRGNSTVGSNPTLSATLVPRVAFASGFLRQWASAFGSAPQTESHSLRHPPPLALNAGELRRDGSAEWSRRLLRRIFSGGGSAKSAKSHPLSLRQLLNLRPSFLRLARSKRRTSLPGATRTRHPAAVAYSELP
jgi:hypothetical protein